MKMTQLNLHNINGRSDAAGSNFEATGQITSFCFLFPNTDRQTGRQAEGLSRKRSKGTADGNHHQEKNMTEKIKMKRVPHEETDHDILSVKLDNVLFTGSMLDVSNASTVNQNVMQSTVPFQQSAV